MYKVLVADKLSPAGMQILEAAADIQVDQTGPMQPAELAAKIPAYDGLIIRSGSRVTAEVVAAAANLKAIGRA
jgi:D-3-phosphoglycerate dehydrogenase